VHVPVLPVLLGRAQITGAELVLQETRTKDSATAAKSFTRVGSALVGIRVSDECMLNGRGTPEIARWNTF